MSRQVTTQGTQSLGWNSAQSSPARSATVSAGIASSASEHRDPWRVVLSLCAALLLAIGAFAASASNAFGAYSHSSVEQKFTVGPSCPHINSIAVDEANGLIYVVCDPVADATIRRFHLDGTPANFSADEKYIQGNEIVANPFVLDGNLGAPRIAVDNSLVHPGFLYVVAGDVTGTVAGTGVAAFAPTGKAIAETPPVDLFPEARHGVDVGPDGSIYTNEGDGGLGKVFVRVVLSTAPR